MDMLQLFTVFILITVVLGIINEKVLKLSPTIGMVIISLVVTIMLYFSPFIDEIIKSYVKYVHFDTILLEVLLGNLLFAGALTMDSEAMDDVRKEIGLSAVLGTLISTAIVSFLFYHFMRMIGVPLSLLQCLIFGALISPTDPIATLAILKGSRCNTEIQSLIAGESLFNDAIGVVLFTSLVDIYKTGIENMKVRELVMFFVKEAGGGIIFGIICGILLLVVLKNIHEHNLIILTTVAAVFGLISLAKLLHFSAPLATVIGALILRKKEEKILSEKNRQYLENFWEVIDENMNLLLFILIGFEIIIVLNSINIEGDKIFSQSIPGILLAGLVTVLIVLFARAVSVMVILSVENFNKTTYKEFFYVLTWGGLRGGLALALVLSLSPYYFFKGYVTAITYVVVLFSIIVQGLTIDKVVKKYT